MKQFTSFPGIFLTISIFLLSFQFCTANTDEKTSYSVSNLKCENRVFSGMSYEDIGGNIVGGVNYLGPFSK